MLEQRRLDGESRHEQAEDAEGEDQFVHTVVVGIRSRLASGGTLGRHLDLPGA